METLNTNGIPQPKVTFATLRGAVDRRKRSSTDDF